MYKPHYGDSRENGCARLLPHSNLKKIVSGSIKAIPRKILLVKQYKCTKKIRSSKMCEATRFFTWIIEYNIKTEITFSNLNCVEQKITRHIYIQNQYQFFNITTFKRCTVKKEIQLFQLVLAMKSCRVLEFPHLFVKP